MTQNLDMEAVRVLLGNKSDQAERRQVQREAAEAFVQKHKFDAYFETSAMTNQGQQVHAAF